MGSIDVRNVVLKAPVRPAKSPTNGMNSTGCQTKMKPVHRRKDSRNSVGVLFGDSRALATGNFITIPYDVAIRLLILRDALEVLQALWYQKKEKKG
mmetsp:Transcript_40080/g.159406  ORF Transcript_40080/g.159406 Transcript_40080/m.159406 type:complete len:96 (-) Transcript_40080:78-365(-)